MRVFVSLCHIVADIHAHLSLFYKYSNFFFFNFDDNISITTFVTSYRSEDESDYDDKDRENDEVVVEILVVQIYSGHIYTL